jgi:hypothetical protein
MSKQMMPTSMIASIDNAVASFFVLLQLQSMPLLSSFFFQYDSSRGGGRSI